MNFEDKKKLAEVLEEFELQYSVNEWEQYGVQFWPILKNIIYFNDRKFSNKSDLTTRDKIAIIPRAGQNRFNALFRKLNVFKIKKKFQETELRESNIIFAGGKTHRIELNNESFNKYFDPIMDDLFDQCRTSSILFEYHDWSLKGVHKKERVFSLHDFYLYFKLKTKTSVKLKISAEMQAVLAEIEGKTNIRSSVLCSRLESSINDILLWKETWLYILKKVKPKKIIGLCYYNNPMYGMNLAAFEMKIPTVDMQHGGQGLMHPAYNFANLKSRTYNLLPNYFWCWDESSYDAIKAWLPAVKSHKAILGGNPWIEYLLQSEFDVSSDQKKIIICTLTIGIKPILDEFVMKAIQESDNEFVWWLRFHPRTPKEDILELKKIIKKAGIQDKIEVEKANSIPLPLIMKKAWGHISRSSGSIGEAAMQNVPVNIISDNVGKLTYQRLIDEGKAYFFDHNSGMSLLQFIYDLKPENLAPIPSEYSCTDYKKILDDII